MVVDNDHTNRHAEVEAWLANHPRIRLPFTLGSRLNLVEVVFGVNTQQAIHRATFASGKQLLAAIKRFLDGWNQRCQPFTWSKMADEILPTPTVHQ